MPRKSRVEPEPAIRGCWDPTRTRVFAVGLLEYDGRVHWSLEKRRDVVLIDALLRRGVPKSAITFLHDANTTVSRFGKELAKSLERSSPDEQLFVYYAGHGGLDPKHGGGTFVLRDGRLPVSQLFTWIERSFRGRLAILTADCCHSGAVAREAPFRAGRIAYAALASSFSSMASTGNWTFTDCWIDAIEGHVRVDLDGDGILRLDELALHAERRLGFVDGQLSTFTVANGFPASFELGPAVRRAHPRDGEFVEAKKRNGTWHKAEIVGERGKKLRVRWARSGSESVVATSDVRPWLPKELPVGTRVSVRYGEKLHAAEILAVRRGIHLIRYAGWDEGWDEWVSADRFHTTTPRRTRTRTP